MSKNKKADNPETVEANKEPFSNMGEVMDAMENIKAIARMGMNTMSGDNCILNNQTIYSAFSVIATLAGGSGDRLFSIEDLYNLEYPPQKEVPRHL